MEEVLSKIDNNIKKDPEILAAVIIEGEKRILYSTENWDISKEIDYINSIWGSTGERYLYLSGDKYTIIQNSIDRLIAVSFDKTGELVKRQESVIGFKDNDRTVLCKIPQNRTGQMLLLAVPKTVNILKELSSKEPYMGPDTTLGKFEELKWTTPKVLLNESLNLQNLGLLRFGLNESEAEVYLTLLKKGEEGENIGNINKELLHLKRTHIYRIIERLEKNGWISQVIEPRQRAQKYRAISLDHIIDDFIKQRETELTILKSLRFILGEKLENGWIDVSELEHDLQSMYSKEYDFSNLGVTGVEKDCGLLIFEYESPVDNHIVIRAALQLSFEKIRAKLFVYEDIDDDIKRGYKNPDLEEIKIIDKKILDYYGSEIFVRFKKGTKTANNVGEDWVIAVKQVAVPIENKIYIVWGSEEKFTILLNMILKLS
ncbi:MAG: helix-turn-helix domain-containing protein [Candidatus Hermodarchaeota archaeon]